MASKRPPNKIDVTPAGIEIAYWDAVGVDGKPQQRRYRVGVNEQGEVVPAVDGMKLPSITTVAGIYDKPGLMPAAVKLQEEGVLELARRGVDLAALDQGELRKVLQEEGLHYDSIWDVARTRGDVAHGMLLDILTDRRPAKLSSFDEDLRPWISGGMKYVAVENPEPLAAEYIVASIQHGFAGRPDLFARLRDGRTARIEFKTVTEWKQKKDYKGNETGVLLPPYDENLIQLALQEIASVESGYDPADCRMVVRLGPDGEYDVTESHATDEVALAALTAYHEKRYLAAGRPEAVAA